LPVLEDCTPTKQNVRSSTPIWRRRPKGRKGSDYLGLQPRDRKQHALQIPIAHALKRQPLVLADLEHADEPRSQPGVH
jgi:hypothetical protein